MVTTEVGTPYGLLQLTEKTLLNHNAFKGRDLS